MGPSDFHDVLEYIVAHDDVDVRNAQVMKKGTLKSYIIDPPPWGHGSMPHLTYSWNGDAQQIPLSYVIGRKLFGERVYEPGALITFRDRNKRNVREGNLVLVKEREPEGVVTQVEVVEGLDRMSLQPRQLEVLEASLAKGFTVDPESGEVMSPQGRKLAMNSIGRATWVIQPYFDAKQHPIPPVLFTAQALWGSRIFKDGNEIQFIDGNRNNPRGGNIRLFIAGEEVQNPLQAHLHFSDSEIDSFLEEPTVEAEIDSILYAVEVLVPPALTEVAEVKPEPEFTVAAEITTPDPTPNGVVKRHPMASYLEMAGVPAAVLDTMSEDEINAVLREVFTAGRPAADILKERLRREWVIERIVVCRRRVTAFTADEALQLAKAEHLEYDTDEVGWRLGEIDYGVATG